MNIGVGNKKHGAKGIYVGRPTALGNPFLPSTRGVGETLVKYRSWLDAQLEAGNENVEAMLDSIAAAAHKQEEVTLVCWCSPAPCHADIIREVVLERYSK